ncbi:hypothetical protein ACMFMG_006952 [Clarireedia jacksonii]
MNQERYWSRDHIDIAGKVRIVRRSLIFLLEQFENIDVPFNFKTTEYILKGLLSDMDSLGRKMLEKPELSLPPYLPDELKKEFNKLRSDIGWMERIMVLRGAGIFIDGRRVTLRGFSEKAGLAIRWLFETGPHILSQRAFRYLKEERPDIKNVRIVVMSRDAPERRRLQRQLKIEFGPKRKKISGRKRSYSHMGIFPRKLEFPPPRTSPKKREVPSMFRDYKGRKVWATGPGVPERQCVCL